GHTAPAEVPDGAQGARAAEAADAPRITLPPTAGEPAPDQPASTAHQDAELAQLVKPAPNTIPRGAAVAPAPAAPAPAPADSPEPSETEHG
ncbi:MAG TPA: hypothetical protein VF469_17395, partial [Kofleriaceae bacterium]